MLLFSSAFAATDYLRTCTPGIAGQLKVETLPESAQSWISSGLQAVYWTVAHVAPNSFRSPSRAWQNLPKAISRKSGPTIAPHVW